MTSQPATHSKESTSSPSQIPSLTDLNEEQLKRLGIIYKSVTIAAEERSKGNESSDAWVPPRHEWLLAYLPAYREHFNLPLVVG